MIISIQIDAHKFCSWFNFRFYIRAYIVSTAVSSNNMLCYDTFDAATSFPHDCDDDGDDDEYERQKNSKSGNKKCSHRKWKWVDRMW